MSGWARVVVVLAGCGGLEAGEATGASEPGVGQQVVGGASVGGRADPEAPGHPRAVALSVSRCTPTSGPVGTRVRVMGSGLVSPDGPTSVKFGSRRCGAPAKVLSAAPGLLEVEVPSFARTNVLTIDVNGEVIQTDERFVVSGQTEE